MPDFYLVEPTGEQKDSVKEKLKHGLIGRLARSKSWGGEYEIYYGLLGETVACDLFECSRGGFARPDEGIDMVVEGVHIDVKTSSYKTRPYFSFDGALLLPKKWMDHQEKEGMIRALLFAGFCKADESVSFMGWLTSNELRNGIDAGRFRVIPKGFYVNETKSVATTETVVIPHGSLRQFTSPESFREQMLDLVTAPPKVWSFEDVPETPTPAVRIIEKKAVDLAGLKVFENVIDESRVAFVVVAEGALLISKMRSLFSEREKVAVRAVGGVAPKQILKEDTEDNRSIFTACHYCSNGMKRYAGGRPRWNGRIVCDRVECQEAYKKEKKYALQTPQQV